MRIESFEDQMGEQDPEVLRVTDITSGADRKLYRYFNNIGLRSFVLNGAPSSIVFIDVLRGHAAALPSVTIRVTIRDGRVIAVPWRC